MASRTEKQALTETLKEKIESATIVLVADYRGLDCAEVGQLRRDMRENEATMLVAKNTLIKRAIAGTEAEGLSDALKGPTALFLGSGDQVGVVKTLKTFLKKNKKKNEMRAAFLEGAALGSDEVAQLADMPSITELRGKLLGAIASPLNGLASAVANPSVSLARCLDQIAEQKKENEAA